MIDNLKTASAQLAGALAALEAAAASKEPDDTPPLTKIGHDLAREVAKRVALSIAELAKALDDLIDGEIMLNESVEKLLARHKS